MKAKTGKHKGLRKKLVTGLSAFVVFCTTYALILPAITLSANADTFCEKEEHVHSPECFRSEQPICGLEEGLAEGHMHGPECYSTEQTLICPEFEDGEFHTHDENCYQSEEVLVCSQEETPAIELHSHSESCYLSNTPLCGKEEHTHSTQCYSNPNAVESEDDWKKSLPEKLDKDKNEAVLQIAKSQLEYKESSANYLVEKNEEELEIKKGYTRYGDWAEDKYGDWTNYFVGWVLKQARIEASFDKDVGVWINTLQQSEDNKLTAEAQKGNVAFYRDENSVIRNGIVSALPGLLDFDKDHIKVIEGDVKDEVKEVKIKKDSVFGYLDFKNTEEDFNSDENIQNSEEDSDTSQSDTSSEHSDQLEASDSEQSEESKARDSEQSEPQNSETEKDESVENSSENSEQPEEDKSSEDHSNSQEDSEAGINSENSNDESEEKEELSSDGSVSVDQPKDGRSVSIVGAKEVQLGDELILKSELSGIDEKDVYSYQWQYQKDADSEWQNVPKEAHSSKLLVVIDEDNINYSYRVIVNVRENNESISPGGNPLYVNQKIVPKIHVNISPENEEDTGTTTPAPTISDEEINDFETYVSEPYSLEGGISTLSVEPVPGPEVLRIDVQKGWSNQNVNHPDQVLVDIRKYKEGANINSENTEDYSVMGTITLSNTNGWAGSYVLENNETISDLSKYRAVEQPVNNWSPIYTTLDIGTELKQTQQLPSNERIVITNADMTKALALKEDENGNKIIGTEDISNLSDKYNLASYPENAIWQVNEHGQIYQAILNRHVKVWDNWTTYYDFYWLSNSSTKVSISKDIDTISSNGDRSFQIDTNGLYSTINRQKYYLDVNSLTYLRNDFSGSKVLKTQEARFEEEKVTLSKINSISGNSEIIIYNTSNKEALSLDNNEVWLDFIPVSVDTNSNPDAMVVWKVDNSGRIIKSVNDTTYYLCVNNGHLSISSNRSSATVLIFSNGNLYYETNGFYSSKVRYYLQNDLTFARDRNPSWNLWQRTTTTIKTSGKKILITNIPNYGGSQITGSDQMKKGFPISKTVDYLGDGVFNKYSGYSDDADLDILANTYRLNLSAGPIAGEVAQSPVNVLFVLDTSGSMNQKPNEGALEDAITAINSVSSDVSNINRDNQVAVVEFSSTARIGVSWTSSSSPYSTYNHPAASGGTNYQAALVQADRLLQKLDATRKNYPTFMVFLSDGKPTMTNSGGDGTESLAGIHDTVTRNTIASFKNKYPSVIISTISYNDSNNDYLRMLATGNRYYDSVSGQIVADMKELIVGPEIKSGMIVDTLSDNVDFDLENLSAVVKARKKGSDPVEEYILLEQKTDKTPPDFPKNLMSGGTPLPASEVFENIANPLILSGKRIELKFKENWVMDPAYEYILSFNVKLTEQAYTTYAQQGYPVFGDDNTDYLDTNNQTSSKKPGLYSNVAETNLTNVSDGNPAVSSFVFTYVNSHKEEETGVKRPYDKPVVQVNQRIALRKFSGESNLAGAEFTLWKDGMLLCEDKKFITNENGLVYLPVLEPGTYVLKEEKAPEGYLISNNTWNITVGSKSDGTKTPNIKIEGLQASIDGTADSEGGSSGSIVNSDKDQSRPVSYEFKLKIENKPGKQLPETGGPGTNLMTFGGSAAAFGSLLMYGFSKRQKKCKEEVRK